MKEGTEYWMTQFLTGEVKYYQEQLSKTTKYNKEEKMLNEGQIKSMNVTEEWDSPQFIDTLGGKLGVYTMQGAGIGGAPCTEAIIKNLIPVLRNQNCNIYMTDWSHEIHR